MEDEKQLLALLRRIKRFRATFEKKYHRKLTDHEERILRTAERLLSRKAHKASE